jgi:hypothetical protein
VNPLIFVGIGEALYDVFEDGTETFRGAPLNFAVHAHQLARRLGVGNGIVVSSINSDQRSKGIIVILFRMGMSTCYIGKDSDHATGFVSVFMPNGEPGYQIESGDACSAGILFGLALGWDIPTTMELANRMGADVVAHLSATPPLSHTTLSFACTRRNPVHDAAAQIQENAGRDFQSAGIGMATDHVEFIDTSVPYSQSVG